MELLLIISLDKEATTFYNSAINNLATHRGLTVNDIVDEGKQ